MRTREREEWKNDLPQTNEEPTGGSVLGQCVACPYAPALTQTKDKCLDCLRGIIGKEF